MSKQSDSHERLAFRLTQILLKFNIGETLYPEQLAEEFAVNRRTIQRDINERFAFLPIEKKGNGYALQSSYLGKLSFKDIDRFASLAGIQGMFPALTSEFIREMLDSRIQDTLSIHGGNFEDILDRIEPFRCLQKAIQGHRIIHFEYRKDGGAKTVADAHPYKLVHHNGIWYLAAADGGKLKAYAFSKIEGLQVSDFQFTAEPAMQQMLEQEDSIWLNEKKTEVILKISKEAAGYFRRRKLIAGQVIEKELENGDIIASGKFAHPNQILPIVRYWIPHVRIISPESWQAEMEDGLATYLKG